MTTVTEVRSASAVCLPVCGAPWRVLLQHSIMLQRLLFIVECGITCFLSTMRVFEVRAPSSPPGYLCSKFRFFGDFHCWASPWRKIAYSIIHSIIQLIWCPGDQSACVSEFNIGQILLTQFSSWIWCIQMTVLASLIPTITLINNST